MRYRSIRVTLLSASLLAVAFATARAGTPQDAACFDQLVTSVKLEVEGHPDYPQSLVSGLDLRKDTPFTREAYRRSVERLVKFGSFEEVTVLCGAATGGVDVTFSAVPPHRLTEVVFEGGDTGLLPRELDHLLREQNNNSLPNIDAGLVRKQVQNILNDEGYLEATVEVRRRETFSNPDRATLIFEIVAGPLATIRNAKVAISNLAAITESRVRTLSGLIDGRPYKRGPIREGLLDVVKELKSKGYYLAAFTEPEARPAGDHTVDVSVDVSPGPRVTLAWDSTGDRPPPGDINDWVPIKAENTIDRDLLDDSKARIEQFFRNEGYSDAKVEILDAATDTERPLKVRIIRGPKYRIDSVEFQPNLHMSQKELQTWLQIKSGDPQGEAKVFAGLGRIANEYRQAGYYRVQIVPKFDPAPNRTQTDKEKWVVARPQITEGPKGQIVQLEFQRSTTLVPEAELRAVMQGGEGHPYVQDMNVTDRVELDRLYLNRGFRLAKVEIAAEFNADGTQVKRVVRIDEGPQVHVSDILVVGWRDISEKAIREELVIHPGSPFGDAAVLESQRRLYQMGVFRLVSLDPEVPIRGGAPVTDVRLIVRVVEAPDTTVFFGGGLEAGRTQRAVTVDRNEPRVEFYPRGSFQVTRRNLGGRNRILSLFTRLSLRPHDAPHDPIKDGQGYVPSQYRVALTYQEKRAFGTDTDWLFGVASEQAIRANFNFRRNGGSTEFTRLLSLRTRATARYTIDRTVLYNVKLLNESDALDVDRAFPQVRLSTFGLGLISDQRDDPVSPSRGKFLAWDGEVAARAIGSEIGYLKTLAQASAYKSLVPSKRFILAGRAEVGVARGFERAAVLPVDNGDGTVTLTPTTVADLPASQRFFAGGSTTVRGFSLDALGTPAVLSNSGLSKGGNGLVVLNAELRTRLMNVFSRRFSTALFADSGNVFAKVSDMSIPQLRGSVGFGVRYESPLGPLRVDFGRKLSVMTFQNGVTESRWEFHISFGEIF